MTTVVRTTASLKLSVTGTATHARKTTDAARHATGAGVLAAGSATDSRNTALAARTAAGAAILAARAAVPVGIAASAARVVLKDDLGRHRTGHAWSSGESVGGGQRRGCDSCSDGPGHYQWFHEV
jgi:hypothetical protein